MNITTIEKPLAPVSVKAKPSFLSRVQKGVIAKPLRVVIYGPEGIGKSTFASQAPKPIWLGVDRGTQHLDIQRLPAMTTWEEIGEAVRELAFAPHEYETLVVDPINWIEPILWNYICRRDSKADIEAYGYGKGYKAALVEWRLFAHTLEDLSDRRGMNVVIVAHSQTKKQKSPDLEDFDRYTFAMHEEAAALFRQWADYVLFAKRNVFTRATDVQGKRFQGVSNGQRTLQTAWSPAFDAKSRPQLPDPLPFPERGGWELFLKARSFVASQLTAKRAEVEALFANANPEHVAQARAFLEEDPNDVRRYDDVIAAFRNTNGQHTTQNTETTS